MQIEFNEKSLTSLICLKTKKNSKQIKIYSKRSPGWNDVLVFAGKLVTK